MNANTMPETVRSDADTIDLMVCEDEHAHPTLRTPDSTRAYLTALTGGGWRAPRVPCFTPEELEDSEP